MASRFSIYRTAAPDAPPVINSAIPAAVEAPSLVPDPQPEAAPPVAAAASMAAQSAVITPPPLPSNPLLSDKLLDAKIRLHRKLIDEINLSVLEKLTDN